MSTKSNRKKPDPTQDNGKIFAMYIAMVVRNAMEDFHSKHLSDKQMKELNPIIRNAIYTALHASDNYEKSNAAKKFVDFNINLIPGYWEQPNLLNDYLMLEKFISGSK
jgi:hypothetical protein